MTSITRRDLGALVTLLLTFVFVPASAQTQTGAPPSAPQDSTALAKQLSNPIASLVSVPFQMNWDNGLGPTKEQTRFLLNFQPVMPFSINTDWNLIARVIVPVLSQPPLVAGGQPTFGMSDLLVTAFFSPAVPKRVIWGVGPALVLPATADPFLGTEKWAAGPGVLVLKQTGPWTYGMLFNHLWSYAGNRARSDVNQTYLQPFLSYTTAGAVTVALSSESAGNWEAESGQEWTVPILVNVSKLVMLGQRPMSIGFGGGGFATKPDGGASWKFRTSITLLFPK